MEPNDIKPAPEPLRVVQEFVNTRSNLRGRDLYAAVDKTSEWLAAHKLLPEGAEK